MDCMDDKILADSYMELIYMVLLPNAININDMESINYYKKKIKKYEEKYGTYPSPIIRLATLNTKFQYNDISLKEYLDEIQKLIPKLKYAADLGVI